MGLKNPRPNQIETNKNLNIFPVFFLRWVKMYRNPLCEQTSIKHSSSDCRENGLKNYAALQKQILKWTLKEPDSPTILK